MRTYPSAYSAARAWAGSDGRKRSALERGIEHTIRRLWKSGEIRPVTNRLGQIRRWVIVEPSDWVVTGPDGAFWGLYPTKREALAALGVDSASRNGVGYVAGDYRLATVDRVGLGEVPTTL